MKNEQLKNYKIFENLTDNQIEKFRPVLNKKEVDGGNREKG